VAFWLQDKAPRVENPLYSLPYDSRSEILPEEHSTSAFIHVAFWLQDKKHFSLDTI